MTPTLDLSSATDREIEAAVHEFVAGIKMIPGKPYGITGGFVPEYLSEANAVLALLPRSHKGEFWTCDAGFLGFRICIRDKDGRIAHEADDNTFCRAACIALLRSAGVAVKE